VFLAYDPDYNPFERIDLAISWIEKFDLDYLNMYFDEPDSTGHSFGADGQEYKDQVSFPHLVKNKI